MTAEHSTRAASRCGTEELAEDVDDDDDNEASALVIDETDRVQYQLVDAVSTGCCTPLKNAVAAEQPALVSGTDDSVDGAAEKSQFWIVVKRHLSPGDVISALCYQFSLCSAQLRLPCGIGQTIIFLSCGFFFLFFLA